MYNIFSSFCETFVKKIFYPVEKGIGAMDKWMDGWRGLVLVDIAILVLIFISLCGCTSKGIFGEISILPDLVPSSTDSPKVAREWQRVSVPPRPNPMPRNPAIPFDGLAWIVLGDEFRHINGLLAQKLAAGCGVYGVEPDDQARRASYYYERQTIPGHRYDLKVVVSRGDWGGYQGFSRVVADVKLVDLATHTSPRMAHAVEFYGDGIDASGRPVRGYATYGRAAEAAIQKAVHGMCFLDSLRGVDLQEERTESLSPVSPGCTPPCYEYQQTIGVYGTWGGYGINSHWPTHDRGQHEHRRGQHHGRGGGKKGK